MINPFSYISPFFSSILKKKEDIQTLSLSLPLSSFQNIREYGEVVGGHETQVEIVDLVPLPNGKNIEFLQRKISPTVPIDKTIDRMYNSIPDSQYSNFLSVPLMIIAII